MANGDKPTCGGVPLISTQADLTINALMLALGLPGTAVSVYAFLTELKVMLILGKWVPLSVVAGGAAGGLGALLVVGIGAYSMLASRPGIAGCYAGIVTRIEEAFPDAGQILFPFTAGHDRVDVVVKPDYWKVVERSPQQFVWCDTDSMASPLIRTYFRTPETVGAAVGALWGAGAAAPVGIWAGLAAGVAIGCSTFWLCLLALVVALIVAAAITLAGASTGGNIGRLAAGSSSPTGTGPGSQNAAEGTILVGDCVTVNANLVIFPEDGNAWVAWWAQRVTRHGASNRGEGEGGGAPFNHVAAQKDLEFDGCQRPAEPAPSPQPPPRSDPPR